MLIDLIPGYVCLIVTSRAPAAFYDRVDATLRVLETGLEVPIHWFVHRGEVGDVKGLPLEAPSEVRAAVSAWARQDEARRWAA